MATAASVPLGGVSESGAAASGTGCLSEEVLLWLLDGDVEEGPARAAAEEHLSGCDHCMTRLEELAGPAPPDVHKLLSSRPVTGRGILTRWLPVVDLPPFQRTNRVPEEKQPIPGAGLLLPAGFTNPMYVGRGGSGVVYRARQSQLGREVAVKILFADQPSRSMMRAEQEAQMLAGLNHPHVIRIYEAQWQHAPPYLVMEWIAGGSLHDRLQRGVLSVEEGSVLAGQLAQGVAAFHALGIVHRDLKPANVLLATGSAGGASGNEPFCAKITDFGLARAVNAPSVESQSGSAVGTPSFMAPEQTHLRPELGPVSQASDIYGVGAVLFAALTGQPPHRGDTALATLMAVAWHEAPWLPTLRSDIPVDLATIVGKCLRPQPGDRYRTALELMDDLHRFRSGEPIVARTYTPGERLRSWLRRNPTLSVSLGLGAAVVLTGLLGIAYHLVQLDRTLEQVRQERNKAEEAARGEQKLRQHALWQANVTNHVAVLPLKGRGAPTAADFELIETLRNFYHEQLQSPREMSADLKEVIGEGLLICGRHEYQFFQRPQRALEDVDLVWGLLVNLPDTASTRRHRGESLLLRFQSHLALNRQPEAEQSLSELIDVLATYEGATNQQQLTHLQTCVATLWNTGHLESALKLARSSLPADNLTEGFVPRSRENWHSLLSLQATEVGLLHRLERSDEAGRSLERWRRMANRFQIENPEQQPILAAQWLRMIAEQLRHLVEHGAHDKVAPWLSEGEAIWEQLWIRQPESADVAAASVDWVLLRTTLPPEFVHPGQVEDRAIGEAWRARQIPSAGDLLPMTLTRLALAVGDRAERAGRFAEALQWARDALASLAQVSPAAGPDPRRLELRACQLAARSAAGLGLVAEEASHLAHAASLASGPDRAELERRLRQLVRFVPRAESQPEAIPPE